MPGNTELNSDGLVVRFGRDQGLRGDRASVTRTAGKINEMVLELTLTGAARTLFTMDRDADGTADGFAVGLDTPLPDGAKVLGFDLIEIEAPAGGTSFAIGTYQVDGTAIDADGIRTDAAADGALIGTTLTQDSYVTAVTTGTYTAGIVQVVIRYMTL